MSKHNGGAVAELHGCRINMYDPERFPKLREAFARRGLGHLQLSSMLRIALDEWVAMQAK
jgi:hypothetical protein